MGRPPKNQAKQQERTFSRTRDVVHDLFKLMPEKCKKNVSYQEHQVTLVDVEHTHFYHSVDPDGRPQPNCVPIAGHFHEMIVTKEATDTSPAILECSPPFKWVKKRNPMNGKWEKVKEPMKFDSHTHDVQYIKSEKYQPAVVNMAAQRYIQSEPLMTPPPALEGVVG